MEICHAEKLDEISIFRYRVAMILRSVSRFIGKFIAKFMCMVMMLMATTARAQISRDLLIPSHAGETVGLCNLGATFLKPKNSPVKALVLFVHGSGTSNRNEQSPAGNQPFKDIAEGLSKNGIASFRFDKRGIQPECRKPLINNPNLTPWHFVRDVMNIIAYIKKDPEMSKLPLVLLGHSEGVNFVTEIASKTNYPFKAVILLAGLGKYSIDKTIIRQYQQIAADPRLPANEKLKIQKVINDGTTFFNKIYAGQAQPTDRFLSIYSKYWIDWITITRNGAVTAQNVKAPSLVIRGTADTNVTADDFTVLKQVTQHVRYSASYEPIGLDHLFALPGTTTVSPLVIYKISTWISSF